MVAESGSTVTAESSCVTVAVAVLLFDPYDARMVQVIPPVSTEALKVDEIPEEGSMAPQEAGSTCQAEANGWPYLSTAANDWPVPSVMATVSGPKVMADVSWTTV